MRFQKMLLSIPNITNIYFYLQKIKSNYEASYFDQFNMTEIGFE